MNGRGIPAAEVYLTLPSMPLVDVMDETYIAVVPHAVVAAFADPDTWPQWWPDLRLTLVQDRGVQGRRWRACSIDRSYVRRCALTGSAELWAEPYRDNATIVHFFLRLDPVTGADRRGTRLRWSARAARRFRERQVLGWKRRIYALKDMLESGT